MTILWQGRTVSSARTSSCAKASRSTRTWWSQVGITCSSRLHHVVGMYSSRGNHVLSIIRDEHVIHTTAQGTPPSARAPLSSLMRRSARRRRSRKQSSRRHQVAIKSSSSRHQGVIKASSSSHPAVIKQSSLSSRDRCRIGSTRSLLINA